MVKRRLPPGLVVAASAAPDGGAVSGRARKSLGTLAAPEEPEARGADDGAPVPLRPREGRSPA